MGRYSHEGHPYGIGLKSMALVFPVNIKLENDLAKSSQEMSVGCMPLGIDGHLCRHLPSSIIKQATIAHKAIHDSALQSSANCKLLGLWFLHGVLRP